MELEQAGSFAPLALLAMRETGAAGYVLYAYENGGSLPVRLASCGLAVPVRDQEGFSVARFPLWVQNREVGTVAFVFRQPAIPEPAWRSLQRMARTLEAVWSLFVAPDRVVELATRISRLQAELADLKIADRARGFLIHPEATGGGVMALHVDSVLQARRFESLMAETVRELENQIEERKLVSQAKTLLQSTYGLSEEQAHARLRLTSRRSRRRLGDVAQQFLKGRYDTQPT